MFAVIDTQGRVVAFSGRALADAPNTVRKEGEDKPAKYINSKESLIYTKGKVLFGLFQARQTIRTEEIAIVVEGNFDVFSLHARGLTNVVAPLGTAFTPDQAGLLKRHAPSCVLLFDGDAAGRKAARSARGPCMEAGLVAKVAGLPDGVDPDDFARTRGAEPLRDMCARAKGMLEFLIDAELDESFVAADVHERLARVERIAALIAAEEDPLARMLAKSYADVVAGRVDIIVGAKSFDALEQKIRATARVARPAPRVPASSLETLGSPSASGKSYETAARHERAEIVGALLDFPSLLDDPEVAEALGYLEGPAVLTVAALRKAWTKEKGLDSAAFLAQIPPAIQGFAHRRFVAPVNESEPAAKECLLVRAQQLKRLILEHEAGHVAREMFRPDDGEERDGELREIAERRAKQLLRKTLGSNANKSGATPHEERPFEEAAGEDGRGRQARQAAGQGDGEEGAAGQGGDAEEHPSPEPEGSGPGEAREDD
jgi:DNA primase